MLLRSIRSARVSTITLSRNESTTPEDADLAAADHSQSALDAMLQRRPEQNWIRH